MKVKRFFAPDMSAAMRMVREEVGPDAVLLSNNSVAGGVEVVVALEYDEAIRESVRKPVAAAAKQTRVKALVGMKKPDRARAEIERARSVLVSEQVRQQQVTSKSNKDRQLNLDDSVWDDVLASLDAKQARKSAAPNVRRFAPEVVDWSGVSATDIVKQTSADSIAVDSVSISKQSAAKARSRSASRSRSMTGGEVSGAVVDVRISKPIADDSIPSLGSQAVDTQEQKALQSMRNEIDELKAMLGVRLKETTEVPAVSATNSVRDRIYKRLQKMSVQQRLAGRLVQAIEPDMGVDRAWKVALSRLVDALPTAGENVADRGGILAFVGATGVGKTTTIGKIAAQYVLKHGSSSVALVTTDTYRIAAHEQLRTFGRILDVPVRVVDENHSLDETLHSLRDKRLVLVDTSGLSMSASQREQQLEMLTSSAYRIKKFLVLPSTAQYRILRACYDHFKYLGLNGAVLTKVDESLSLGESVSLLVEQRLPVAYIADGQKIPDNIEVARANGLVSRAVVLAEEQAKADRVRLESESESEQSPLYADHSYVG